MSVEWTLNRSALQAVVRKESTRSLLKAQRRVLAKAVTMSPRSPIATHSSSGQLRQSHHAGPVRLSSRGAQADIVAEQSYAMAVHEGSRPHVIRPRRAKVLAWKGAKGMVFARTVHHPGAKAKPWLLNALKAEGPALGFEVDS